MFSKLKFILKNPLKIFGILISYLPSFRFLRETNDYQNTVGFGFWFLQKVINFGGNKAAYWPVHWASQVYDVQNIFVGVDSYPGIMKGCYIQGKGGIYIGNYTQIAPNVVIVSANHDLYDTRKHIPAPVKIGNYCWLGAGCKIMPGVVLGDFTIVAAGAVVTKSFPQGNCVIGGVPANEIKKLEPQLCIPYKNKHEYNGYIKSSEFEAFRKKYLNV